MAALSLTPGDVSPVLIHGQSTGAIGVTVVNDADPSTYDVSWSEDLPESADRTSASAKMGLPAGSYTITVTPKDGGEPTAHTYVVTQNDALQIVAGNVRHVDVHGEATGEITVSSAVGGTGSYVFAWTGAVTSPSDPGAKSALRAGDYVIAATDSAGATATHTYTVTENDRLVLVAGAISDVVISGQRTGVIAACEVSGGVPPYAGRWTTTSPTAPDDGYGEKTGLAAGSYLLTVTDAVDAEANYTFLVRENGPIVIGGGAVTDVGVYGAATGAISAPAVSGGSGGYVYSWSASNGQPLSTTLGPKVSLMAGSFTLTVSDSAGGVASRTYVVSQVPRIVVSGRVLVFGASTGAITSPTVTGGSGSYVSYQWSSSFGSSPILAPTTLATKVGLRAGSYSLAVSDTNGGTATQVFVVPQNDRLTIAPGAVTTVQTFGGQSGAIAASVISGGTGTFNVSWTTDAVTPVPRPTSPDAKTGLAAGVYTMTVVDSANASATARIVVPQYSLLRISPGAVRHCALRAPLGGAIDTTRVKGGSGQLASVVWSRVAPGGTRAIEQSTSLARKRNLKHGSYRVRIRDSGGAEAEHVYVVEEHTGRQYRLPSVGHTFRRSSQM